MPDDLKSQLRALVEAAPPVSAEEVIARAAARPGALRDDRTTRRGHLARPAAVAACAVGLACAGIGWAVASPNSPKHAPNPAVLPQHQPKVILTAAEVKAITAHSTAAAASSGTAEVTQTSTQNGVPQDGYDTAVTFAGQNIDEKITSVPEPPGSANSFTTDDRFVDGQFYIYTPGPNDVPEWLHDTNSTNDAASMQFPDPRTLYQAINPEAQFRVDGTTTMNGETVTHLVAGDPSAIDTPALGNLSAGATVTSMAIWVDANDVVRQIALSTSTTNRACRWGPFTSAERQKLRHTAAQTITLPDGIRVRGIKLGSIQSLRSLPGSKDCGPMTTTSNVMVTFANLGVPESVTAPQGAVDVAAKG